MARRTKTEQAIVDDCNALARKFYGMQGYEVDEKYRFYESDHPAEVGVWNLAAAAYDYIEGTDVESALAEIEDAE